MNRYVYVRTGFVLCLLFALSVGALGNPVEVRNLSLEDAIRQGLEASVAMQKANLEVQHMQLEYNQAEVNARATVTPLQLADVKQKLENAQFQIQLQRVRTALTIESHYYKVMQARDTVELRRNAFDRATQQHDIAVRRHGAGQITDLQLRETEQQLKQAAHAYRRATHNLHLARMEFAQLVGLEGDDWELTDEVEFMRDEAELETALQIAMDNRFELTEAWQKLQAAQRAVELADNAYTPRVELEKAQIALAQAELNYRNAQDDVAREVWHAVFRLDEAEANYELVHERHDLALDNLALAELRYQNGLNTLLDVLQAEAVLAESEVSLVAAMYEYNVARATYLSAIGMGFDRWPHVLSAATEAQQ